MNTLPQKSAEAASVMWSRVVLFLTCFTGVALAWVTAQEPPALPQTVLAFGLFQPKYPSSPKPAPWHGVAPLPPWEQGAQVDPEQEERAEGIVESPSPDAYPCCRAGARYPRIGGHFQPGLLTGQRWSVSAGVVASDSPTLAQMPYSYCDL